tara:strand:+ start:561 stop:986 length:426 start_codon:yes stop_codon:yes gene_type:complete
MTFLFLISMKCDSCNKITDSIEVHHIVPRSKGGGNNKGNLINLCIDCHSKVHNVDFSGKDGLISKALKKRKEKLKKAKLFIENNKISVYKKIDEFCKYDYENGILLCKLIESGIIDSIMLLNFLKSGKLYLKNKLILNYEF